MRPESQPHSTGSLDLESAMAIESPAFDRSLRIGVLLDSLTTPRWVAKIMQDIAAAPFLTLSLVIVNASEKQSRPATWREWLARQRAAAPYRLWEWYQAADYQRFRSEGTRTIARSSMFEVIDGRLMRFRRRR